MKLFGTFTSVVSGLSGPLMAVLAGGLAGALVQHLASRRRLNRAVDAIHRRCWDQQDRWLDEHESELVALQARSAEDALREVELRASRDAIEAIHRADRAALETLQTEIDGLRAAAEEAARAQAALVQERDRGVVAMEQIRRELDATRASHRHAEQALCQQLLGLDRQVGAERSAHRREVQALRDQCDEWRAEAAGARAEVLALRERHAGERLAWQARLDEADHACASRDALRQEVGKLLGLLEEADGAQAALQARVQTLDQQAQLSQRQLDDLRGELDRLRGRSTGRARRERRVYPSHLPPGVADRRAHGDRELIAA